MPSLAGLELQSGASLFLGVWIAGLLGSWHCAGMCGAFCVVASRGPRPRFAQSAYHLGRLTTYLVLATTLHTLGLGFRSIFHHLGVPGWGMTLFVILVSVWAAFLAFGLWERVPGFSALSRFAGGRVARINRRLGLTGAPASYLLGATSTLLPCMWLYGFLFVAASRRNLSETFLVILLFWTTNIPWLFASQALLGWIQRLLRGWSRPLGAAFLAAIVAWGAYKTMPRVHTIDLIPGMNGSCCHPAEHKSQRPDTSNSKPLVPVPAEP
jgi:sulfite exporter TauE/SafE